MSAEYSFDEAEALRHVADGADVKQLRAAVLTVINTADSGGLVDDEVRGLKHLLWTALTSAHEPESEAATSETVPEIRVVTGTHHQAGAVRTGNVGRRYVGFQLEENG